MRNQRLRSFTKVACENTNTHRNGDGDDDGDDDDDDDCDFINLIKD